MCFKAVHSYRTIFMRAELILLEVIDIIFFLFFFLMEIESPNVLPCRTEDNWNSNLYTLLLKYQILYRTQVSPDNTQFLHQDPLLSLQAENKHCTKGKWVSIFSIVRWADLRQLPDTPAQSLFHFPCPQQDKGTT